MDAGMTLPVMEPDLWEREDTLEAWSRAIDAGPYSSLCFGERLAFDNPETLTLLGAVSAWTSRVRLVTTVVVPQLHAPVPLAKALATADRLCGGRLSVGLGVGGREEDYAAAGVDRSARTLRELGERAAVLQRVWAGERVTDSVRPVGPPPVQPGGPPLLVGTMGPRTVRAAAGWAAGLAGVTLDLDLAAVAGLYDVARAAWADAGRGTPWLATSFWVALAPTEADVPAARAQVHRHLRHYMNWLPPGVVDAIAPTTGFAGTAAQLGELLARLADLGTDEVHLIPTSCDLGELDRVSALLAQGGGGVPSRSAAARAATSPSGASYPGK